jgi:hypothetical protein
MIAVTVTVVNNNINVLTELSAGMNNYNKLQITS